MYMPAVLASFRKALELKWCTKWRMYYCKNVVHSDWRSIVFSGLCIVYLLHWSHVMWNYKVTQIFNSPSDVICQ